MCLARVYKKQIQLSVEWLYGLVLKFFFGPVSCLVISYVGRGEFFVSCSGVDVIGVKSVIEGLG